MSAPRPGADTAGALGAPLILTPEERASVAGVARGAWALNTRRTYATNWKAFTGWCERTGRVALPASPEVVAAYLGHVADLPVASRPTFATVEARLAAIRHFHRIAGHTSPTRDDRVRIMVQGLRRRLGSAPKRAKAAATADVLSTLLARVDRETMQGKRDAALLLVAFALGSRRSEVVAIDVEHLTPRERGFDVLLPRSKTDQEGRGRSVGIAHWHGTGPNGDARCPACALTEWLVIAGIEAGPIFRGISYKGNLRAGRLHEGEVARVVKRYARLAGLDVANLSSHSLRAGHVTEGYLQGVPEATMMASTGHTSVDMLRRYRRVPDAIESGTAGAMNPWAPKDPTDASR